MVEGVGEGTLELAFLTCVLPGTGNQGCVVVRIACRRIPVQHGMHVARAKRTWCMSSLIGACTSTAGYKRIFVSC